MPEAPFIQQHAIPTEPKFLAKFWSIKFEKVCKLFEHATILQIIHFLNHVTADPGCDLPSRGVPKRGPQKCRFFGVPVFGPVLPRSSCNLPQNMVPGPKSTFLDHVTRFPGYDLPSEGGPISTFFYFGSLFGHLRMVKHHLDLVWHGPKSGPNPKVTLRTVGRTWEILVQLGPLVVE